jgi:hypothetical protein
MSQPPFTSTSLLRRFSCCKQEEETDRRDSFCDRHKPLFDLATAAAAMRARKEEGEFVVEVKPLRAILLSNFPSGDVSSTPARAIARTARKRKERSDEDGEADPIETGAIQRRSKRACLNL